MYTEIAQFKNRFSLPHREETLIKQTSNTDIPIPKPRGHFPAHYNIPLPREQFPHYQGRVFFFPPKFSQN